VKASTRSPDEEHRLFGEAVERRDQLQKSSRTRRFFLPMLLVSLDGARRAVRSVSLSFSRLCTKPALALRRSVFKVETIGDCYVAAIGLPTPQNDHAVIMVRFADDCMRRMRQLTAELATSLGDDTANLEIRIGLHSGPVTGGVLRGQKSRFQLFGDTMNTASRMESNGMSGRIHVSQETAEELCAKGKSTWVTSREDKIVAKGKGEMQTYWVNVRATALSTSQSSDAGVLTSNSKGTLQCGCIEL
jgi:class 3 adenylate cyclase